LALLPIETGWLLIKLAGFFVRAGLLAWFVQWQEVCHVCAMARSVPCLCNGKKCAMFVGMVCAMARSVPCLC